MIQHFHDLETARAQMRSDALTLLKANSSVDQACQTILDGMVEFEARTPDNDDAEFFDVDLTGSIAGRLRSRGLVEWADALQTHSAFARSPEPSGYEIKILIGRSAGLFCSGSPGERRFALVRHLRDVIPFESADFLNAAEPILKLNASAVVALTAMLRQRAADFATRPRRLARVYDCDLGRLAQMRSEEMRFADVWDHSRQRVVVWPRDLDAYELRRADIDAYLDLLEDFDLHGTLYQILEAADRWASTAELCLLLKGARPVFDKDCEWIKQTRLAFIVINFLGSRLLDQPFENGEPSEHFKETLTEIIEALTTRPDAIPLGYAWLQRLFMSPGGTRSRPGVIADSRLSTALILVAVNLAPHLRPHPSPLKWIEAELYVWRNWRISALLAVEICRVPIDKNAIATLITEVLLNELASSVGLDHLGSGSNIGRRIIGNAIIQIPDLAAWFADLLKRLFWQRDRFRWLRHRDPSRPNVSQIIVLWGASGLELLDAGSAEARSFWLELYGAIRESILTEAFRQHNDAWSIALRFVGALWLKTFPDNPPAGTPGSLQDLVLPWKRVDTDFGELIEVLDRYGVAPE
jgi:hypothetical protein